MSAVKPNTFFPYTNPKLSKDLIKYGRAAFGILVHLITGHNRLNRHNSIVLHNHPQDDSGCRHCGEDEESSFHVFARCDKFAIHRRNWFFHDKLDHPFQKLKAQKLIGFLRDARIEGLQETDLMPG